MIPYSNKNKCPEFTLGRLISQRPRWVYGMNGVDPAVNMVNCEGWGRCYKRTCRVRNHRLCDRNYKLLHFDLSQLNTYFHSQTLKLLNHLESPQVDFYIIDCKKFQMRSLLCLLLVVSVVLLSQLINSNPPVNAAENLDRFWSILTGDQQLPHVTTDALGYVGLKFQDDRTKLLFIVNAEHIGKVTAVYLYQIDKEQNATILLDVLHSPRELIKGVDKVVDKTPEGKTKGTVSMGGATSDDLQGRLKGKSLSDLRELIVNGTVYVSIHTKDFPNAEIGGNSFVGIDRLFPDFVDLKWK